MDANEAIRRELPASRVRDGLGDASDEGRRASGQVTRDRDDQTVGDVWPGLSRGTPHIVKQTIPYVA